MLFEFNLGNTYYNLNNEDILDTPLVKKLQNLLRNADRFSDSVILHDMVYTHCLALHQRLLHDANITKDTALKVPIIYSLTGYNARRFLNPLKRIDDTFDFMVGLNLRGISAHLTYENGNLVHVHDTNGVDILDSIRPILELRNLMYLEGFADLNVVTLPIAFVVADENRELVYNWNNNAVANISSAYLLLQHANDPDAPIECLDYVVYNFADEELVFSTYSDRIAYLENMGLPVTPYWVIDSETYATLKEDLGNIIEDCLSEFAIENYDYYVEGLRFDLDDTNLFNWLNADNTTEYYYGKGDFRVNTTDTKLYSAYVQTILWQGDTYKQPYAIIGQLPDITYFEEPDAPNYIEDITKVQNMTDLGVTIGDKTITQIPLYNKGLMWYLNAFKGNQINFKYTKDLGVLLCDNNGNVFIEEYVKRNLFLER